MLALGFSAGLPILLIFSSLSIWLSEAGVQKSTITFFSWAALAYSFKFVWAPLVDALPLPMLTKRFGQRRAWLLLAQAGIVLAINLIALTDPSLIGSATVMALFAVLLGFSSATQDIVIDAYRIECAPKSIQGMLSASYTAGYRIGMIVAGAGGLFIAEFLGSTKESYSYIAWQHTYQIMSLFMLIGIATTLLVKEPVRANASTQHFTTQQYGRFFLSFLASVVVLVLSFNGLGIFIDAFFLQSAGVIAFALEAFRLCISIAAAVIFAKGLSRSGVLNAQLFHQGYVSPIKSFFDDYGRHTAILVLAIIASYRSSDIILGVMSNLFYTDMGYSKSEIAAAVKTFGVLMAIAGSFFGGMICLRLSVLRVLTLGCVLVMVTNLMFILLIYSEKDMSMLYTVIALDNLAGGIATTAFIAFLSALVNVQFTAVQYSIFSSLMTLLPKFLGGYSGTIVEAFNYELFFLFSASLCLPVLLLIHLASKHLHLNSD